MQAKTLCGGANNPNNHEIPSRGIITMHALTQSLEKNKTKQNKKQQQQ